MCDRLSFLKKIHISGILFLSNKITYLECNVYYIGTYSKNCYILIYTILFKYSEYSFLNTVLLDTPNDNNNIVKLTTEVI